MTQWQKAQTDSAAWPCEAEAWKKEKKIDRETMDVGLWEWLGGGEDAQIMVKSLVLNAIHLTEWFPRLLQ